VKLRDSCVNRLRTANSALFTPKENRFCSIAQGENLGGKGVDTIYCYQTRYHMALGGRLLIA